MKLNRRELIGAAVATGTAGMLLPAAAAEGDRAPLLTADEMADVDQALGKKGTLVADQAVYTVPLPRADLKVTIQGDAVPTPFGFGGWVSLKKMRDGRSTVLMSD